MRLNKCEAAVEKITDIIEKHNRQRRTAQQMVKSQTSPPAGVSELPKALWESVYRRRCTPMFGEASVGFAGGLEVQEETLLSSDGTEEGRAGASGAESPGRAGGGEDQRLAPLSDLHGERACELQSLQF